MRALIIQNDAQDPPGRVLDVLHQLKWEIEIVLMGQEQKVPFFEDFHCMVLLGGPMNVDDVTEYPYLKKIRTITADALEKGFPVLGLCLGAQMLSRASGCIVQRNSGRELGWCKVRLTEEGLKDPVMAGIESSLEVFQWHYDMFEQPNKSSLLAISDRCRNQIIRIGKLSYGFQSHIEVNLQIVSNWITSNYNEVESVLGPGGAEKLLQLTVERMPVYDAVCSSILLNYFRMVAAINK
ncbi:MAG: type 1 glutamine amidotransferase [Bacillota bacterium]